MRFRFTIVDLLVLSVTALLLGNMAWQSIDEWRGSSSGAPDAKQDLAAGVIGIKGYGKPSPWQGHFQTILSMRFNARYDHQPSCGVSPYDRCYIEAYNEVMAPSLSSKGINLEALRVEARSMANNPTESGKRDE